MKARITATNSSVSRRVFYALVTLTLVASGMLSQTGHAHAQTESTIAIEGITYTLSNSPTNHATVTSWGSYHHTTDVVIRDAINRGGTLYPVTEVGANAFDNLYANRSLTSVAMPSTITTIGESAFRGNPNLKSVDLPEDLIRLGDGAFWDSGLTSVDFPEGLTAISDAAFYNNDLTSVDLPEGITSIGVHAFETNNLASVDLPDGVTTIGRYAFSENDLASVGLPEALTSIGIYAFFENQLASLRIPGTVTDIGNNAFWGNRLTSVAIPDGVTTIGHGVFGENDLTSVDLPNGITNIGIHAFGSNRLTSVDLPDEVTIIDHGAFDNNELTSVVIPEGVTAVQRSAFARNSDLTAVKFTGPAPTIQGAADDPEPSFGNDPRLLIQYPVAYGQAGPGSYSSPLWHGYSAQPYGLIVTFDATGGTLIAPVTVDNDEAVAKPVAPTREGYVFTGWYTDREATIEYDFASPVTETLTLYAGWEALPDETEPAPVPSGSLDALFTGSAS